MRSTNERFVTVIVLVSLALGISACSSGNKQNATSATTGVGGPTTVAANPAQGTGTARAIPNTSSSPAAAATGKPLLIGVTTDITGPTGYLGSLDLAGLQTYVYYVNNHGGIGGRPIKLTVLDNHNDGTTGVNQYRELVSDGVVAVFGVEGSLVTSQLGPLAAREKVAVVSQAYVSSFVLQPQPYVFARDMSPVTTAKLQVSFLQKLAQAAPTSTPKVGILSIDTPAAQEFRDAVQAEVKKLGWSVADSEQLAIAATDVSAQASKMAAAHPDFIVSLMLDPQVSLMVPALRQQGIRSPVVEGFYGNNSETFALLNDPDFYAIRDFASVNDTGSAAATMRQRAEDAGQAKNAHSYQFVLGYVSGMVLQAALQKCGPSCAAEGFNKALESVNNVDTQGLSGPVGFAPDKHYMTTFGRAYHWDNQSKHLVAIGDWVSASP
jgi:ABC-type branched-subunit amino acid transport system substrate-binding protein